jgi:hypothetical protein
MAKSSFIGDLVIPISSASGGEEGQLRYNDATGALQVHNGTEWITNGAASGEWFKKIAQSGSATVTQATTADDTLQIAAVGDLIIGQGAKSLIFENTQSEPTNCCSISGGYAYTSDYRKTDINDVDFTDTKSVHLRAGTHTLGASGTETYSGLNITADAGAVLVLKDGITLENCNINVPTLTQTTRINTINLYGNCIITADEIASCAFATLDVDSEGKITETTTNVTIHCGIWYNNAINMAGGFVCLHAMHDKGTLGFDSTTSIFNVHYGVLEIHGLHCTNSYANIRIAGKAQITLTDCYFKSSSYTVLIQNSNANEIYLAFRNSLFATTAAYCVYNPTANSNQYILNQGSISTRANYGTYSYTGDAWNIQADVANFY